MLFLVISVFAYALNNVLWKFMLLSFSPSILLATRALFTTAIAFSLGSIFAPSVFRISLAGYTSSFLASVSGAAGLFCMISALKQGTLKLLALYNLLTVFFIACYLFVFEAFDPFIFGYGSILMLSGYLLFFLQSKDNQMNWSLDIHFRFLLMAVFFSVSGIMHWYNLLDNIHPLVVAAHQEFVVFILGLCLIKIYKVNRTEIRQIFSIKYLSFILLMAAVIFVAVYCGLIGMLESNPFLLSITSLAVPVLTFFFGVLFFKERCSIQSIIALLTMLVAAYLLS